MKHRWVAPAKVAAPLTFKWKGVHHPVTVKFVMFQKKMFCPSKQFDINRRNIEHIYPRIVKAHRQPASCGLHSGPRIIDFRNER
jgi:hypothetical protein